MYCMTDICFRTWQSSFLNNSYVMSQMLKNNHLIICSIWWEDGFQKKVALKTEFTGPNRLIRGHGADVSTRLCMTFRRVTLSKVDGLDNSYRHHADMSELSKSCTFDNVTQITCPNVIHNLMEIFVPGSQFWPVELLLLKIYMLHPSVPCKHAFSCQYRACTAYTGPMLAASDQYRPGTGT